MLVRALRAFVTGCSQQLDVVSIFRDGTRWPLDALQLGLVSICGHGVTGKLPNYADWQQLCKDDQKQARSPHGLEVFCARLLTSSLSL